MKNKVSIIVRSDVDGDDRFFIYKINLIHNITVCI